ncbi:MAG TPA: hypothetical protein PLS90_17325 [Candidatus Sumerlaeota bacterium]|nr:hypothetical protein [Candidatus Sumerlaeota bacterium]HOR29051.1 hypothetical protein [Candidatus Sumerlaeota bacterium]HPK04210.1 hypothetical protein [Candidatus Sumerlaeota bacterium]
MATGKHPYLITNATEFGIFRSTDDGSTWSEVSSGLTNLDVRALVVDAEGTLYAGTAGGVFRSTYLVPAELSAFSVE